MSKIQHFKQSGTHRRFKKKKQQSYRLRYLSCSDKTIQKIKIKKKKSCCLGDLEITKSHFFANYLSYNSKTNCLKKIIKSTIFFIFFYIYIFG